MAALTAQVDAVKQAIRAQVESVPRDVAVAAYNQRRNTDGAPAVTLTLLDGVVPLIVPTPTAAAAEEPSSRSASYDTIVIACTPSTKPWSQLAADTLASVAELARALRANRLRCSAATASAHEIRELHSAIVRAPDHDASVFVEDALRRSFPNESVDGLLRRARDVLLVYARHFTKFHAPAEMKAMTACENGRPSTIAGLDLASYVAIGMATGSRVVLLLPRPRALALPSTVAAADENALLVDLAGLYPEGLAPPAAAPVVTFALLLGVLPMATQELPPPPQSEPLPSAAPVATTLTLVEPPKPTTGRGHGSDRFVQADVGAVYSAQTSASWRAVPIPTRVDPHVTRSMTGSLPAPRRSEGDGSSDDGDDDDGDDGDDDEEAGGDRSDDAYVDEEDGAMDVEENARRPRSKRRSRGRSSQPTRRVGDAEYEAANAAVFHPSDDDSDNAVDGGSGGASSAAPAMEEEEEDDGTSADAASGSSSAADAASGSSGVRSRTAPRYVVPHRRPCTLDPLVVLTDIRAAWSS